MEVQIRSLQGKSDSRVCLLSKYIYNSLDITKETEYTLHVGQISLPVLIEVEASSENTILIPEALIDDLYIPEGLTVNIRGNGKNIHLGPVVGVFMNYTWLTEYKDGNASKLDGRGAQSENCLCYYFSINNIIWDEKKIWGYTLSPQTGNWTSGWFPFPDVIYDRAVHFKKEEKPLVKDIREKFKNHLGVKFINNCDYLGKWETYTELLNYPEVRGYLPKTCRYTSFNEVIMMLKQHDFIFIKSYYGSGGKQVLSIEKADGKYRVVYYSGGLKELLLKDIDELRAHVDKYVEGKKFIIQEGIRLLKYNNQVFDMRVEINKDRNGEWKVIYNFLRIAKSNFTITNYSAGGDGAYYEDIYVQLEKQHPNLDYSKISDATIRIAEYIEKAFGSMGELGMDIGMDIYGKIWFIEANTKPDKGHSELPEWTSTPRESLALFEYCKYLSGF